MNSGSDRTSGGQAASSRHERGVVTPAARQSLLRLAYRFLWNRQDAEDAVQDALLAVQQKRGALREADRWWSWLCRILVHRCHELGRRKQARRRYEGRVRESAAVAHDTVDRRDERMQRLAGLLDALPRRQREVLVLRHLQEMSFEQIGEVLAMSAETARVHAMRGRERLMDLVQRHHPEWVSEWEGRSGVKR